MKATLTRGVLRGGEQPPLSAGESRGRGEAASGGGHQEILDYKKTPPGGRSPPPKTFDIPIKSNLPPGGEAPPTTTPDITITKKAPLRTASRDTVRNGTERKLHEETELSIIIV